ncbi:hypothetical protein DPV78_003479 [Talaromyces pinophilus]|nr:hypothetical protein DPV78_003479 [Talaromyces pinophilus]
MLHLVVVTIFSSFAEGKLVDVPDSTEKPDQNIICFSQPWYKVAIFFLVNYVAHAATIMPLPGQPILLGFLDFLTAVFLPYSGLWRGVSGIWQSICFSRTRWNQIWNRPGILPKWKEFRNYNRLEEAARAGALAVIIRSKSWSPQPKQVMKVSRESLEHISDSQPPYTPVEVGGSLIDNHNASKSAIIQSRGDFLDTEPIFPDEKNGFKYVDPSFGEIRRVHGLLHLPDEYSIAILPPNTKVEFNGQGDQHRPYFNTSENKIAPPYQRNILSSNYNIPKALIAIVQVYFALYSLTTPSNRAQISKYGFAAFSLTVLPYLVMSLTNLIASVMTPSYPALYLVRSEEMGEAESRGARFDGVVGSIDQNVTSDTLTATIPDSDYKCHESPEDVANNPSERASLRVSPFSCSPFARLDDSNGHGKFYDWSYNAFCVFLTLVPLAVVGGLSEFKGKKSSTLSQISMMLWFGYDCVYGLLVPKLRQLLLRAMLKRSHTDKPNFHKKYEKTARLYIIFVYFLSFIFFAPSVWGFISVVDMLYDWGQCIYLQY